MASLRETRLRTFDLAYDDDGRGVARTIKFEALNESKALQIAQTVQRGRSGVLSEAGRPICRLERRSAMGGAEVWVVTGLGVH